MMKHSMLGYLVLCLALNPSPSFSEDYFGEFPDELAGSFKIVDGKTLFVTSAPFQFKDPNGLDWPVPVNQGTDGASIPSIFWPFIGHPMEGEYLWAAVVHDYYWRVRTRTSDATHRAFYNGMRAKGIEPWKADLMYWAVLVFGDSWTIQKEVATEPRCTQRDDGTVTCENVTTIKDVAVAQPGADLADPEVLAIAEAKMAAIARTLKTTDGAILDVSTFGQVIASPEQIEQSASAYRDIFSTESFRQNPEQLGLLTEWGVSTLDTVVVWPDRVLPTIDESPSWNEFLLERPDDAQVRNFDHLTNLGGYNLQPGELEGLSNDFLTNLNSRPQLHSEFQLGPTLER